MEFKTMRDPDFKNQPIKHNRIVRHALAKTSCLDENEFLKERGNWSLLNEEICIDFDDYYDIFFNERYTKRCLLLKYS